MVINTPEPLSVTRMSDFEGEFCLPMTPLPLSLPSLPLPLSPHHAKVNPDYVRCLTGAE